MKYNFQNWLKTKVSDEPEVILAGKLEHLRLYLTDAMRELREKAGLTQAQLAEKLGVQQAAVSKLESALKEHKMESVIEYLHALDADLLVAVKKGDELYHVSDNDCMVLVDVPEKVTQQAEAAGMSLREYILAAIRQYSLNAFLQSDDPVAVQVRERLRGRSRDQRSLPEMAANLEKFLSLLEENDRLLAALKNVLSRRMTAVMTKRDSSDDEDDESGLRDLAESLLKKLGEF